MSYPVGWVAIAVIVCSAVSAFADDAARPGNLAVLAAEPEVQVDLGVQGEPKAKLTRVARTLAQEGASNVVAHEKIGALLTADQMTRLNQIRWQRIGGESVFEPEVAQALRLDDAQKKKLEPVRRINEEEHAKMLDNLKRVRFRSSAARHEYIAKYQNAARARFTVALDETLTKEQQNTYRTLLGKMAPGLPKPDAAPTP